MFWFLYNLLFVVGFSLMLPRFLWRMRRRGGYRAGFMERFGRYDASVAKRLADARPVWIHAVSVGEVKVAMSFIREMRAIYCDVPVVLTTTTSTGRAVAGRLLDAADVLLYFPLDVPLVMRRALARLNPRLIVLTECEIWPNLLRLADEATIPVTIINGRISDASYRGYKLLGPVMRRLLPTIDRALMQTKQDAERLIDLGALREHVEAVGTAKYDLVTDVTGAVAEGRRILKQLAIAADAPVIVGGSTWDGEEKVLLDAFKGLREQYPGLVLILVPRHAERAPRLRTLLEGSSVKYLCRSECGEDRVEEPPDVLMVDTTGELLNFYAVASVVFVGKSLCDRGGQNPIEPAALGRAVVVGPYMGNFPGVMEDFVEAGGIRQVASADELRETLGHLLASPEARDALGEAARAVVEARRGTAGRSLKLLETYIQ